MDLQFATLHPIEKGSSEGKRYIPKNMFKTDHYNRLGTAVTSHNITTMAYIHTYIHYTLYTYIYIYIITISSIYPHSTCLPTSVPKAQQIPANLDARPGTSSPSGFVSRVSRCCQKLSTPLSQPLISLEATGDRPHRLEVFSDKRGVIGI